VRHELHLTRPDLKTLTAGAAAGILFSILLIVSMVLIWASVPTSPQDAGTWLPRNWRTVNLALNLLPFAGIAFLWFMGVLRDRVGIYEDRFLSTVFLGSGFLFLAMLFASSAVAGGIVMIYGATSAKLMGSATYAFGRIVTHQMMQVYTMKMAAVFMISTCTVSIRTGIIPRWLALLGYALAVALLLSLGYLYWIPLVFPLWVLLVSVHILFANLKPHPQPVP
jgi:hypothetical protein